MPKQTVKRPKLAKSKGPLSAVSAANETGKKAMRRLYIMSKFRGIKMTPFLLHIIDQAWAKFITDFGQIPAVNRLMAIEDMDGNTDPLSTYKGA
ncbi:hypothetical protein UFOVP184_16 [uncultured Caudovirales phage]|uniref:Uncharacterized protein n=1 Tax=uncultured Caudovirales phage TaxID=2100421 RepID=A0A6J7WDE0_9CAUD|nr:hypothetical protein UFOVP184_16 [uncultured Caudovirales phage]